MIKRICSVWLVGAIIVLAGTALKPQTSLLEAPVVALAAAFAPQPILAQDPACDACVLNDDDPENPFHQCCLGCCDVPEPDPEWECITECSTPTPEGCDSAEPCEPTLAFHLLRGDGTLIPVDVGNETMPYVRTFGSDAVLAASDGEPPRSSKVLLQCDGSIVGREYSRAWMATLREASRQVVL